MQGIGTTLFTQTTYTARRVTQPHAIPTNATPLKARRESESSPRGQSLVELALVIPILFVMALAIFDFARVFTAAITIEAAAREAADYGALYPWYWDLDTPGAIAVTEATMEGRACSAASTLPDYMGDGPSDTAECTNPTFSYVADKPAGVVNCYEVPRDEPACRVTVTVDFDFETIVPLGLQFGDTTLGLPSTVALSRTSTFAISDFELDRELEP